MKKKSTKFADKMERFKGAVSDVEKVVKVHGLDAVAWVVNKTKQKISAEAKLQARKNKLEAELARLEEQLH